MNEIDDDDNHANAPSGSISGGSWVLPVYDAAGNMTAGPKPGAETTKHCYQYDAWNRLRRVFVDGDSDGVWDDEQTDTLVAEYRYDALHRRIAKIRPDTAHQGKYVRTDFYYTPSWQIAQTRENDNLDSKETIATARKYEYIWDVRYIDAPVCRDENKNADNDCTDAATGIQGSNSGDEHLYYCNDANMNVTAILDGYDGATVERYAYDPYGKPTILNGVRDSTGTGTTEWNTRSTNTFQNAILYCGYFFDDESGLYSVRRRYYHATLGRWPSRDPIGYAESANLYGYVRSMPIRRVDPYGLWDQDFHQFMTGLLAVNAGMCFPSEVGAWANAPDTGWKKAGWKGVVEMIALTFVDPVPAFEKQRAIQEWHFPVAPGADQVEPGSGYAARKYLDGIERCNLMDFAKGLHVFQDSWAHQGKPGIMGKSSGDIGHGRKRASTPGPAELSTDADNVEYWPEDARAAAQATFKAMQDFMDACPCILEGPHQYEKSRCGEGMAGSIEPWLEEQYPGENRPSIGGYGYKPPSVDTVDPTARPDENWFPGWYGGP